MHVKKRNVRAMLYRSRYVGKGTEDAAHGYAVLEFVGSFSLDSQEFPEKLVAKLSLEEREYINSICELPKGGRNAH